MAPTLIDFALMSAFAYETDYGEKKLSTELPDWSIVSTYSNNQSGLAIVIYSNTDERVISVRGTANLENIYDNLRLIADKAPLIFVEAHEYLQSIQLGSTPYKNYFTGHSLGALVAEFLACKFFSPATTFEGPGSKQWLKNFQKEDAAKLITSYLVDRYWINSVVVKQYTYVSTFHEQAGTVFSICTDISDNQNSLGLCDLTDVFMLSDLANPRRIWKIALVKAMHSQNNIVKSIRSGRYNPIEKTNQWPCISLDKIINYVTTKEAVGISSQELKSIKGENAMSVLKEIEAEAESQMDENLEGTQKSRKEEEEEKKKNVKGKLGVVGAIAGGTAGLLIGGPIGATAGFLAAGGGAIIGYTVGASLDMAIKFGDELSKKLKNGYNELLKYIKENPFKAKIFSFLSGVFLNIKALYICYSKSNINKKLTSSELFKRVYKKTFDLVEKIPCTEEIEMGAKCFCDSAEIALFDPKILKALKEADSEVYLPIERAKNIIKKANEATQEPLPLANKVQNYAGTSITNASTAVTFRSEVTDNSYNVPNQVCKVGSIQDRQHQRPITPNDLHNGLKAYSAGEETFEEQDYKTARLRFKESKKYYGFFITQFPEHPKAAAAQEDINTLNPGGRYSPGKLRPAT